MPTPDTDAVSFGMTCAADNLEAARDFYRKVYPDYERMTDGVLGTIQYFSIVGKDGEVLVNVLQRQADNPVRTAVPM